VWYIYIYIYIYIFLCVCECTSNEIRGIAHSIKRTHSTLHGSTLCFQGLHLFTSTCRLVVVNLKSQKNDNVKKFKKFNLWWYPPGGIPAVKPWWHSSSVYIPPTTSGARLSPSASLEWSHTCREHILVREHTLAREHNLKRWLA
jgi:hypothetical protein